MVFYVAVLASIILARCGSVLGWRCSVSSAGLILAICCIPLFILSMMGKLPKIFEFAPYFIFGSALYVSTTRGGRTARAVLFVSLAAIVGQFLAQPSYHEALSFERAVTTQFVLLLCLLSLMIVLAVAQFKHLRRLDRSLGDLTYPLYLSHTNVMIVVLSMTVGYSYKTLFIGLAAAFLTAVASYLMLEPFVRVIRDTVRGGCVDQLLGNTSNPHAAALVPKFDFVQQPDRAAAR